MKNNSISLGSLFDGIGAVPYAASFFGINAIWASEILPNAVSVTHRHFPEMEHLGDITKLDGGKMPPAQVIAFGSPCQSFSVAGNRTSFDGKSGLFFEAIRIIKEMRCATNGKYPEIVLFENVPGLLNVDSRRSYKTVLEAFCEAEIPMPKSGRWANAGMVRGRGIDVAWIIKDAQYYRTAQRRKRLFLICDFTGQRAAEILFVSKSLSRYFTACERERERTAADVESGVRSTGKGINPEIAGTLDASYGKGTGMRGGIERDVVLCAATGQSNAEILENLSATLNCNCEQPIICKAKKEIAILNDQGGNSLSVEKDDISPTLRSETHGNLPIVCAAFMAGQAKNARSIAYSETVSPTLKGSPSGLNQMPCICETAYTMRMREGCAGGGKGALIQTEKSGTLATGNDQYLFSPYKQKDIHPDITGTLCASGAGLSRPAGMASETDLCVAYAMTMGNYMSPALEQSPTLMAGANKDRPFIAMKEPDPKATALTNSGDCVGGGSETLVTAVDCRNYKEIYEMSGTLQAKNTPGYSLNYQNPIRTGYVVRRLTPTEAERLMSLPDGWTEYGHDGKLMSDTTRYQMCGNSIVVNCLAYIMQNIADSLNETKGATNDEGI